MRRRMHEPIPRAGQWLRPGIVGYYRYHAVSGNIDRLESFHRALIHLWYRMLKRRRNKSKITWSAMYTIADQWLPAPRIYHPYPNERLRVST